MVPPRNFLPPPLLNLLEGGGHLLTGSLFMNTGLSDRV